MKEDSTLLDDLAANHKAIGRDESIYSRASNEILRLQSLIDARLDACEECEVCGCRVFVCDGCGRQK